MKNKILLFIFVSIFGASAIIEPITNAADLVSGATHAAQLNTADQIAGASTDVNGNYIEGSNTSNGEIIAGATTLGGLANGPTSDLTAGASTRSHEDDDEYEDHYEDEDDDEYEDHYEYEDDDHDNYYLGHDDDEWDD